MLGGDGAVRRLRAAQAWNVGLVQIRQRLVHRDAPSAAEGGGHARPPFVAKLLRATDSAGTTGLTHVESDQPNHHLPPFRYPLLCLD